MSDEQQGAMEPEGACKWGGFIDDQASDTEAHVSAGSRLLPTCPNPVGPDGYCDVHRPMVAAAGGEGDTEGHG